MNKDIIPFDFSGRQLRALERNGEFWFVAKDVCNILEIVNSRDALSQLDQDEKDCVGITDAMGRLRETNIISEPGLYALISKSRKKAARKFSRWVNHDVLPTLRKTGRYEIKPAMTQGTLVDRQVFQVPEILPAEVQAAKPKTRESALRMALQTARLDGLKARDMWHIFTAYCKMLDAPAAE